MTEPSTAPLTFSPPSSSTRIEGWTPPGDVQPLVVEVPWRDVTRNTIDYRPLRFHNPDMLTEEIRDVVYDRIQNVTRPDPDFLRTAVLAEDAPLLGDWLAQVGLPLEVIGKTAEAVAAAYFARP